MPEGCHLPFKRRSVCLKVFVVAHALADSARESMPNSTPSSCPASWAPATSWGAHQGWNPVTWDAWALACFPLKVPVSSSVS